MRRLPIPLDLLEMEHQSSSIKIIIIVIFLFAFSAIISMRFTAATDRQAGVGSLTQPRRTDQAFVFLFVIVVILTWPTCAGDRDKVNGDQKGDRLGGMEHAVQLVDYLFSPRLLSR